MKSFLNKRTLVEYQRLMYNLCHLYYSWAAGLSENKLREDKLSAFLPVEEEFIFFLKLKTIPRCYIILLEI